MEIITADQVNLWLSSGKDIRLADCRFSLSDSEWGIQEYQKSHIKGAVYFDLEKDLSGPVTIHGGRHPLPDLDFFKSLLEDYGIDNESIVVAYDQGGAPFAARFWWLMKYIGHDKVYVVNGGLHKLKQAGLPMDSNIPVNKNSHYVVKLREDWLAEVEEVRKVSKGEKQAVLIDSREYKRYIGEFEPIDKKAGHIPRAINKDWQEGIQGHQFKPQSDQKERFKGMNQEQEIIVYCGSGVTAAPNMLLLKDVGYKNVKLYLGSFSDWISYEDHPIETCGKGSK